MAKRRIKNNSSHKSPVDKSKQGCAVSFLNEERGEMDKLCETTEDSSDVYQQPRKEKEAGGEG